MYIVHCIFLVTYDRNFYFHFDIKKRLKTLKNKNDVI